MISINVIGAVFLKQMKDTLKNLQVLILFLVFPAIGAVMTTTLGPEAGDTSFFITIFATMHCVITPITATASIMAEEKEKNTLRALIMSGMREMEYLISIGGFVLIATLLTGSLFLFLNKGDTETAFLFFGAMCMESIISIIAGMCVGVYAKNSAAATGIAMPCGMLFAFIPMVASFNESIAQVSKYLYSQQIAFLFSGIHEKQQEGVIIVIANSILFFVIFSILFRTRGLEE